MFKMLLRLMCTGFKSFVLLGLSVLLFFFKVRVSRLVFVCVVLRILEHSGL